MKYLEQRIEELELEVKLIKAKDKLGEIKINDYTFNPSVNFMSGSGLDTVFTSPSNNYEITNNTLENITSDFHITLDDFEHMESSIKYPEIVGSWDDKSFNDLVNKNATDDYGFKMNYEATSAKLDSYFLKNSLELKIEQDFGKIVFKFKILNHEWEMDGYGYVIDDGVDYRKIVVTDHGKLKIADKDYLANKIKEYEEIIKETKKAINLFK